MSALIDFNLSQKQSKAAKLDNVVALNFSQPEFKAKPQVAPVRQDKGLQAGLPILMQRVLALGILLMLSPLLIVAVLLIRFESKGAAMFTQTRVGYQGRQFAIYKLRSMYLKDDPLYQEPDVNSSDRDGVCAKYFNDPRITKVGKWIRKLSIDELPQLLNVIRGEMLLIGPRPALIKEVDAYRFEQLQRLNCMPGMTGLWQVSGRADTSFSEQMQLDIDYVKGVSCWMDIKILFATIPAVLLAKGAY